MKNQTVVLLYLLGFALVFITASYLFTARANIHRANVVNLSAKLDHMHSEIASNMLHTKNFLVNDASNTSLFANEESSNVEFKRRSNRSIFAMVDEILMDPELSKEISRAKLSSIKVELNKHSRAFNWVVSRLKEKGNNDVGVIGNTLKTSNSLMDNVLVEPADVLDIRNSEKDFLLTNKEEYINLVKQKLSVVHEKLLNNPSDKDRAKAVALLLNYEEDFDRLVRIGQETGIRTNTGYYAQMMFWEDKLFATVNQLRSKADKINASDPVINQYAVLILSIAMIISAFVFSRLISSNLSARFDIAQRNFAPQKPTQFIRRMSA